MEDFYRLLDGKFQIRFTQPLVDQKGYKSKGIVQKRVLYSLNSLRSIRLYASCALLMSECTFPLDSSHPEFVFHARMTATNPVESSQPVTSIEQESEEVVEVEPEVEEVISMMSQAKKKGKEKVQGSGTRILLFLATSSHCVGHVGST